MKEHFSPRSLIFYGCAIASVVILFSFVSTYGEKNLQAPRRIDGRYPLSLPASKACFQDKSVDLFVQQSGVFLTGSLLPQDAPEQAVRIAQERPSLSGRWQNEQLLLEGSLGRDWSCPDSLKIEGKLTQDSLNGAIHLSSMSTPIPISGDRQAPQPQEKPH